MPHTVAPICIEPAAQPLFAIIWLHGLGASGHDFVPIIPHLRVPEQYPVRFIFPNAPHIAVTINAGYRMPAWYDILALTPDSRIVDQAGIDRSVLQIGQLIEQQIATGIASTHIFLAGFSQGGAIAYQAALGYGQPLAGVVALSTYLTDASRIIAQFNPVQHDLPVLAAHGTGDQVVSLGMGQQAAQVVQQLGCQVSWREYPMQHALCSQQIADIGQWLSQHMQRITAAQQ